MIIELMEQKFRGVLRLSRQWPRCIITPMAYKKKPVGKVSSPDDLLKKQAYGIAMFGTAEEYKDPIEPEDIHTSNIFGDGFEEIPAPTKSSGTKLPPRAYWCGYNHRAELLVIIFRGPGKTVKGQWVRDTGKPEPWIFYNGVDKDTWESLKVATSTGDWLRQELDGYAWSDVPGNNKTGLKSVVDSILES